MGRWMTRTIDDVHIVVSSDGLVSGWDIVTVTAGGRSAMPKRDGEFATDEEAIAAALERAEQFKATRGQ